MTRLPKDKQPLEHRLRQMPEDIWQAAVREKAELTIQKKRQATMDEAFYSLIRKGVKNVAI